MDINTLKALSTVLVFITFLSISIWAFSTKNKKKFHDAANLPFMDDNHTDETKQSISQNNHRDR